MYGCSGKFQNQSQESLIPDIIKWRRTEFSDYEKIHQLTRMKTYDLFGHGVNPAKISEKSCLSLVQINDANEVVSNISLCNYPNIPSVPVNDWLQWISHHYGIHGITQRNTLFIHMLIWDTRYNDLFYKRILDAVFISSVKTNNVIFIIPPFVTPVGFVEEHMARVVPIGQNDNYRIQALYISLRHMHCPRLKIRRLVEEDNDDIVPILDRESGRFKELYGDFYISEMMRYPDGLRQMVVAEADGVATGILGLNKNIDLQSLNQHFELTPYHGLQKHRHLNHTRENSIASCENKQFLFMHSDILFPADEIRNGNYSKVKPATMSVMKKSEFYSPREVNDDFRSDEDQTKLPDCTCNSNDGEFRDNFHSKIPTQPCPSCIQILETCSARLMSLDISTADDNDTQSLITDERKSVDDSYSSKMIYDNRKDISNSIVVSKEKINYMFHDGETSLVGQNQNKFYFANQLNLKNENVHQETFHEKDVFQRQFSAMDGNSKTKNGSRSTVNFETSETDDRDKMDLDENNADNTRVIEDVAVEINPRKIIHKEINVPVFDEDAETNAFTLEIFSMRDDIDERFSHDYLEAVFECFPEQDYCVLLIPPVFPTFTLLQNFVRVPLRFNKDYPLVMYLTHRAAVVGELKTREAQTSDIVALKNLLSDVPKNENVLKDFELAIGQESPYLPYIFLCQETVVGLAILRVENEIEYIRSHYRIDDFICFDNTPIDSHAQIIHMIIMPIFSSLHRYFLQELMNISDKQALYYRLYHKDASALTRSEPLVTFLGEMIPVLPRKQLKYFVKNYQDNKPADFLIDKPINSNFALYMMVPRVASTEKIDVNVRVVVVGASDCGLSLLETLVFGPKSSSVSFTNITLISPGGIPFENQHEDTENDHGIYYSGGSGYSKDYRHLVGTRSWINVVHGTMTAINRKDKFVTVSGMGNLSYDYLILTCGLQYQRAKFVKELRAEKNGEFHDHPNPEHCFTINNEREGANFLNYCKRVMAENPSCCVVFYGRNIDCYSSIATVLDYGINPENVTLVEPGVKICETYHSSFNDNDEIEEEVMNAMKESGVHVLSGWDLVDWIFNNDSNDMLKKNLIIEQKRKRKVLACDVFINFSEKTINLNTFLAICKAGLVFDGSLVIDPEFQTNDPSIFAAGTMTKYSRRFYADELSHKYHNSVEIGERLGNKLRNIIDPKNCDDEISSTPIKSKLDMTLPVFKKPVITSCRLPGGFNYLDVRKPGKFTADDVNDVGLITGYPSSSIGYFRIQLNQFDAVETVTCASKEEFEIENYISLYGKHQTLLNDLKIRFQKSMIPDLYAYFREPWAVALFLDTFECLRVENRATLLSSTVVCGDTLITDCTRALIKSKWEAKMLKSVSPRLSPRGGEQRIIRLTTDQEAVLQEQFNRCPRAPHTADIVLLAAETGLSEADVQGWYAVRLAQWRKEQGLGGNLHFSH